jgi:flagellar biosynthetic protein FlhB
MAGGWLTRDLSAALTPFIAHAGSIDVSSGGAVVVEAGDHRRPAAW